MNEFKFSCPNCQQNIQATPEYAGMEINCPSCQTPIVVPQPSQAAAPRPVGKLSKAASTAQHAATTPVMATTIVRKAKKPRVGLYVGLGVGAVAIAAGIMFAPKLIDKYHEHKDKVAAEQFAATNVPPPPPPDLSADEILKKIDATYKGLPSFSAQVDSVGNIDMSQVNPALKEPLHPTAKLSILLGRGGKYRMEWEREAGAQVQKGAIWSSGKGDFVRTGSSTARKVKDRETAMNTARAMSGTMGVGFGDLFFNSTDTLTTMLKNYSKMNNETVNGRKCYVLTGDANSQKVMFWVDKDDFLVLQAKMTLGGNIDTSKMPRLSASQKKQMEAMSKIKGDMTETYTEIETNKTLKDADFQVAAAPKR